MANFDDFSGVKKQFIHQLFKFDDKIDIRLKNRDCFSDEKDVLYCIKGLLEDYMSKYVF